MVLNRLERRTLRPWRDNFLRISVNFGAVVKTLHGEENIAAVWARWKTTWVIGPGMNGRWTMALKVLGFLVRASHFLRKAIHYAHKVGKYWANAGVADTHMPCEQCGTRQRDGHRNLGYQNRCVVAKDTPWNSFQVEKVTSHPRGILDVSQLKSGISRGNAQNNAREATSLCLSSTYKSSPVVDLVTSTSVDFELEMAVSLGADHCPTRCRYTAPDSSGQVSRSIRLHRANLEASIAGVDTVNTGTTLEPLRLCGYVLRLEVRSRLVGKYGFRVNLMPAELVSMATLVIIDYLQTFRLEVCEICLEYSVESDEYPIHDDPICSCGYCPSECYLLIISWECRPTLASLSTMISVLLAEAYARVCDFRSRRVNHDVPGASLYGMYESKYRETYQSPPKIVQAGKFTLMGKALSTIQYIPTVAPRAINCLPTLTDPIGRHLVSAVFALSAASELVIFLFMCWFAFRKFRECRSGLYTIFIRDGVVYFVLLTVMAATNTLMSLLAPLGFSLAFASIQSTTAFILSTRMILHLRRVSQEQPVVRILNCLQQRQETPLSPGSIRFGPWLSSGLENSWITNSIGR
ncbi:hypothetical protein FA15DRAFT_697970 [Coprinopsis marcescibilis]|uniref:Uncharacterized protein n=1 Tax=Coprinopsis marcescibilis TaxID=230819 RepID=A0A5C3KF94_COPMA|nr:hypothetical protein FA15DRAFT_697970 [Coprinopsis marcescibilis]